jgi:hypothetical protein
MIEFNRSMYTLSKRSVLATGIKGKVPAAPMILKLIDAIMHSVVGMNPHIVLRILYFVLCV